MFIAMMWYLDKLMQRWHSSPTLVEPLTLSSPHQVGASNLRYDGHNLLHWLVGKAGGLARDYQQFPWEVRQHRLSVDDCPRPPGLKGGPSHFYSCQQPWMPTALGSIPRRIPRATRSTIKGVPAGPRHCVNVIHLEGLANKEGISSLLMPTRGS